jgi:hypothetical protein
MGGTCSMHGRSDKCARTRNVRWKTFGRSTRARSWSTNSSSYMKLQGSLPCSQHADTGLRLKLDECRPRPYFFRIYFDVVLQFTLYRLRGLMTSS